jgi:hypothetical protein
MNKTITVHAMLGFDRAVPDGTPEELRDAAGYIDFSMSDKDLGPFPDDQFRPGWKWRRVEMEVSADSRDADSAVNNSAIQRGLGCVDPRYRRQTMKNKTEDQTMKTITVHALLGGEGPRFCGASCPEELSAAADMRYFTLTSEELPQGPYPDDLFYVQVEMEVRADSDEAKMARANSRSGVRLVTVAGDSPGESETTTGHALLGEDPRFLSAPPCPECQGQSATAP